MRTIHCKICDSRVDGYSEVIEDHIAYHSNAQQRAILTPENYIELAPPTASRCGVCLADALPHDVFCYAHRAAANRIAAEQTETAQTVADMISHNFPAAFDTSSNARYSDADIAPLLDALNFIDTADFRSTYPTALDIVLKFRRTARAALAAFKVSQ